MAGCLRINPELLSWGPATLLPAPRPDEWPCCWRDRLVLELTGAVRASLKGALHVSTHRLVFIARAPDAAGVEAVEIPFETVSGETFKQPVFGANRLEGRCRAPGGGDVRWAVYFREGGFGTAVPVVWRALAYFRAMARAAAGGGDGGGDSGGGEGAPPPSAPPAFLTEAAALVDPSDPTQIILTRPAGAVALAGVAAAPRV